MATNNAINLNKPIPAFSAYLSATQNNVSGDGTVFKIICDTASYNTGVYDTGTGIFTANHDGIFLFTAGIYLSGLTTSHTFGFCYITAGALNFYFYGANPGVMKDATNGLIVNSAVITTLDAGDTAALYVDVRNGVKSVDVVLNDTWFQCYELSVI